jgi:hypothetical protein
MGESDLAPPSKGWRYRNRKTGMEAFILLAAISLTLLGLAATRTHRR